MDLSQLLNYIWAFLISRSLWVPFVSILLYMVWTNRTNGANWTSYNKWIKIYVEYAKELKQLRKQLSTLETAVNDMISKLGGLQETLKMKGLPREGTLTVNGVKDEAKDDEMDEVEMEQEDSADEKEPDHVETPRRVPSAIIEKLRKELTS